MSGENIVVWGTAKVLESAGVSLYNNSIAKATNNYSVDTDGKGFPDAEFTLSINYGASVPTENGMIALYARPITPEGQVGMTEAPEATRPTVFIGIFAVNNVSGWQDIVLGPGGFARDLPRNAEYHIHASGVAQMANSWKLVVTPRSYKAAP